MNTFTFTLNQYFDSREIETESEIDELARIVAMRKEIIANTPQVATPTVNEKYEAMIGRVDRMEVLEYVIFLQEEGYSKQEVLRMEEDFEYMSKEDIDSLIGYEFKERTFLFNALGAKRANAA